MKMLTPYWPTRSFASDLFDEVDRMFEDMERFFPVPPVTEKFWMPVADVSEGDDHYLMSVDLPGLKKEDIKIEVDDNVLTISGERKRQTSDESNGVRYGRFYGAFKRSFTLPASVDSEKIEARYEDGVLELYLPKSQAAKTRRIEIQSTKGGIFEKLLGGKKSNSNLKDVMAEKVS